VLEWVSIPIAGRRSVYTPTTINGEQHERGSEQRSRKTELT